MTAVTERGHRMTDVIETSGLTSGTAGSPR